MQEEMWLKCPYSLPLCDACKSTATIPETDITTHKQLFRNEGGREDMELHLCLFRRWDEYVPGHCQAPNLTVG